MRKRILALLCSAVMLLCLFPATASAAGSLEGVDYSRIGGTGSRVTLTLGELQFEGQLSRGSMISQSEQDAIIKQTMNELKITSGMLINAKSMLDKAHKLEGFGIKDVTNALLKLTGAETTVDLYKHVMGTGNKTSEQIAADIAKGHVMDAAEKTLEDVLTQGGKVALQGGGKYAFKLLFLLPDLTEIGLDALVKYENNKETLAVALERQLLLDAFYDTVNQRIAQQSGDRGAWEIRFDGSKNYRTYNCTFWGISGVMMQATLSGVLEQVSEIDGHAGQYRGTIWLDLEGVDMANSFANRLKETAPIATAINLWKSEGFPIEEHCTTALLTRKVQGEISVMITGGSGTQVSEVSGSLTSGGDETEFALEHRVSTHESVSVSSITRKVIHNQYLSSSAVDSLTIGGETIMEGTDIPTQKDVEPPFTVPRDIGTVWKPLESKPTITIYK